MRCRVCGCEFDDEGRSCPNCGNPVAPHAKRRWRNVLLIGGGALLLAVLAVALSWAFLWGEAPRARRAAEARDALCTQIDDEVHGLIAPYLNEEGAIDYDEDVLAQAADEDVLAQAAEDVYDYAEDLQQQGVIEGAAKCDAGASVSFFLNDGTTHVYLPPIQDAMAGGGRLSILTFNMLPDGVGYHLGFENPGEIIDRANPATS